VKQLPEPWLSVYTERRPAILQRLEDFGSVPQEQYFYELAFCILTPQSSARNAEATISELIQGDFFGRGFDPTPHLRDPSHYIRFHNVKGKRLLVVRENFSTLIPLLGNKAAEPNELRESVLNTVSGLGMKEASHFLRNIGVRGLAILDRHIFKHLHSLKVIKEIPTSVTPKRYLEIEAAWKKYSKQLDISLDELDLLFWSMETGEILK
jgi:N-glycosylase/DNA lyase